MFPPPENDHPISNAASKVLESAGTGSLTKSRSGSCVDTPRKSMATDPKAREQAVIAIRQCFDVCETYGKTPQQLETMVDAMIGMLGDYQPDLVMRAFRTHVERSSKLPTLADIVGLIRRGGRPEVTYSDVIEARKVPADTRTPEDWELIRRWDAQQQEGWSVADSHTDEALRSENRRLREEVMELKKRNTALAIELRVIREELEKKPKITEDRRALDTIEWLRSVGATEAEIRSVAQSAMAMQEHTA